MVGVLSRQNRYGYERAARIHLFRTSRRTLGYQGGEDQQTEPGQAKEMARWTDAQSTSQLARGFCLNRCLNLYMGGLQIIGSGRIDYGANGGCEVTGRSIVGFDKPNGVVVISA